MLYFVYSRIGRVKLVLRQGTVPTFRRIFKVLCVEWRSLTTLFCLSFPRVRIDLTIVALRVTRLGH